MTIDEAIERLNIMRIDTKLELEDDDYAIVITHKEDVNALVYAIEALKYKSFADNAIKVLNNTIANERREYEDKVRKCIERIDKVRDKYERLQEGNFAYCDMQVIRMYSEMERVLGLAIEIIKEEMGCENDSNYISILNRFNIRIHISFYDVEFD